jgi:ribosome biogenesis GTPase
VFEDIEALAASCRFTDCRHESEPGCAVLAAIEDGSLDPARLARWRKLQAEDAFNSASLAERREKGPRLRQARPQRSDGEIPIERVIASGKRTIRYALVCSTEPQ